MSRVKHIHRSNIDKIYRIYSKIINRLPATFPRTALVVHMNLKELQQYYIDTEGEEPPDKLPFAFCDMNTFTVHVHLTMTEESIQDIAYYFLHEIGHLYALHRYGPDDDRWDDYKTAEAFANRFARRWLNRMKQEGRLRL